MKTKVILVRHGETVWNKMRKFQGMSDIPLNETGKEQGSYAKEALLSERIDVCYSSPLSRARETAEIICAPHQDLHPITLYDLHEQNAGKWEGLTSDEIIQIYPKEYDDWCNRPSIAFLEGGETFPCVQERALKAFWQIVHANLGKTILLVSHMVCISTILDHFSGVDLDEIWMHPISNAGINRIEVETPDDFSEASPDLSPEELSEMPSTPLAGETAKVTAWNENEHLPEQYRRKPMFLKQN